MASGNKKQIRDIYKRIDGLATSLKRGAAKDDPITPEHEEAIAVLAAYEQYSPYYTKQANPCIGTSKR